MRCLTEGLRFFEDGAYSKQKVSDKEFFLRKKINQDVHLRPHLLPHQDRVADPARMYIQYRFHSPGMDQPKVLRGSMIVFATVHGLGRMFVYR